MNAENEGRGSARTTGNSTWGSLLVLALLAAPGMAAQSGDAKKTDAPKPATAQAEYSKKLDEIVKRLEAAQDELRKKLDAAANDDERQTLIEKWPGAALRAEFKALAQEAKGTDVAAQAWIRVARLALDSEDEKASADAQLAVKTLLSDSLTSPSIAALPFMLGGVLSMEEAQKAWSDLLAKSPHKAVQAAALYMQVLVVAQKEEASGQEDPELHKLYERLAKDFGDAKMPDSEKTFKALAEGWLFARDNLRVGKLVPDFEATDENGAKFKLSDYKGKVVVLDFWGHW